MRSPPDPNAAYRLSRYLDDIGTLLGRSERRASFAVYATGLLGSAERKSAEPLAALHCPDPKEVDPAHQRLLHFLANSPWRDAPVRNFAAHYALEEMGKQEPVENWIFDDTGFLKQGTHSVGVQRQYTGSAGKVTNCQVGVSLTVTTQTMQVPVDMELYLPSSWVEDAARRREARIPQSTVFQTKPQIALAMADRALAAGVPKGMVLADAGYGNGSPFRVGLRRRGLPFAVDVERHSNVRVVGAHGRLGKERSIDDVAISLGRVSFRKVTWREGSKVALWSRFAACRVVVPEDAKELGRQEEYWLLMDWPPKEPRPTKFTLVTMPSGTSLKTLVRRSRQRWRTERVYEDLKGELGLDHYEGRTYGGWNHHVTVALCCYAFTAAEHARSFPPSGGGPG